MRILSSGSSLKSRKASLGSLCALSALLIPKFKVLLTHRGRSIEAVAGFDSGNESIAIVYPSIADRLGLPSISSIDIVGVGSKRGFTSKIDSIGVVGSPLCAVKNASIVILDINDPRFEVLIGDPFLKATNSVIDFNEQGSIITCKGASAAEVARESTGLDPLTIALMVVGGVLAVSALVLLSGKKPSPSSRISP